MNGKKLERDGDSLLQDGNEIGLLFKPNEDSGYETLFGLKFMYLKPKKRLLNIKERDIHDDGKELQKEEWFFDLI